ncbi:hypothetical protein CEXT_786581 [Caerostris extrusa]|uniref:Uncharacterized protein n=1 Tax=Caerostris extrusa TaxID=172846 RepID=A0AAV4RXV1_CAEEX|nr:hypothetical protein CEXT_786581 [Caerostris extrusa]
MFIKGIALRGFIGIPNFIGIGIGKKARMPLRKTCKKILIKIKLLRNWKKRLEEGDSTAEAVREKRFVQPFKDQVIDLNPQAFLDIEASVNAHQQVCRSYASGVLNQKRKENAGC